MAVNEHGMRKAGVLGGFFADREQTTWDLLGGFMRRMLLSHGCKAKAY